MATTIAVVGLIWFGALGMWCAMRFAGYRRPSQQEKAIMREINSLRHEVATLRRALGMQ